MVWLIARKLPLQRWLSDGVHGGGAYIQRHYRTLDMRCEWSDAKVPRRWEKRKAKVIEKLRGVLWIVCSMHALLNKEPKSFFRWSDVFFLPLFLSIKWIFKLISIFGSFSNLCQVIFKNFAICIDYDDS